MKYSYNHKWFRASTALLVLLVMGLCTYYAGTTVDYRSQLANKPFLSPKDYPFLATGNGTTSDSAAIQAAINSLGSSPGTVHIPCGTYLLTSGLTISHNSQNLVGEDEKCVKFLGGYSGDTPMLKVHSASGQLLWNDVSHIWFRGACYPTLGNTCPNYAIQFDNTARNTIHNLEFDGIGKSCIDLLTVYEASVFNIHTAWSGFNQGVPGSAPYYPTSASIHIGSSSTGGGSTEINLSHLLIGPIGSAIAVDYFSASPFAQSHIHFSDVFIEGSSVALSGGNNDVPQENLPLIELHYTQDVTFSGMMMSFHYHPTYHSRDVVLFQDNIRNFEDDFSQVNWYVVDPGVTPPVVNSLWNTGSSSASGLVQGTCHQCDVDDEYGVLTANQITLGTHVTPLADFSYLGPLTKTQLFGSVVSGNGTVWNSYGVEDSFNVVASSSTPPWLSWTGDASSSSGTIICPTGQPALGGGEYLYGNFTVPSGQTCPGFAGIASSIIRVTGVCNIAGNIVLGANIAPAYYGNVGGAGGGGGSDATNPGGNGVNVSWNQQAQSVAGSGGTTGGNAGNVGTNYSGWYNEFLSMGFMSVLGGSAGGLGADNSASGGKGGTGLVLVCGSINFTGSISADGGAGIDGGSGTGGGGGGGGGFIVMATPKWIANTGTLSAVGGAGGAAGSGTSGAGAKGNDGWTKQFTIQ